MEPCDADRRARWLLRIRASEHARIKKMPIRRLLAVGLPLFAALVVPTLAGAAPGDRDRSFGRNGRVITAFRSGSAAATSTVIDSRGRIIAAGWAVFRPGTPVGTVRFALARFKPSGRLDATFGGDGRVTTKIERFANVWSLALDAKARIVAAGEAATRPGEPDVALSRYTRSGRLDASFGGDGRVTTDLGGYDVADSVAVDSLGRIVVAGRTATLQPDSSSLALARYLPSGELDRSFGNDGIVTSDLIGLSESMAIDTHDRVITAGPSVGLGVSVLARYTTDGDPDPSFGTGGQVLTDYSGWWWRGVSDLAIQTNGKIVAAGFANALDATGSPTARGRFALARYEESGRLDPSFSTDGLVTTDAARCRGCVSSGASSVAIDSRGRIVAAGSAFARAAPLRQPVETYALARYKPNGRVDRSFGDNGTVSGSLGRHGWGAWSAALDPFDRIVIVDGTRERFGRFRVARFKG